MTSARIGSRQLQAALVAVLVVISIAYLLRPVRDPDFFWHLKTGQWIWEHRGLPASDPFSYTGSAIATMAARLTLTSYWASQLLYHFVFAFGGMAGIVALRVVILVALFAVIWRRRDGDPLIELALLLVFAVVFLERFGLERPQVLSFLFFGVLLVLLDGLRAAGRSPAPLRGYRGPLAVALLMLLWSNVHGGFVLGLVTIAVCLAAEGAKFAHASLRPVTGETYRALLVAGCAGLVAAFANPNSYRALESVTVQEAGAVPGLALIVEYLSSAEAFLHHQHYTEAVNWVVMLLAAAEVVSNPKRFDLTEALLLAGTGYFSCQHIRYGPIFLIVALPAAGRFLSTPARARWARVGLVAGALGLVLIFAGDESGGLRRLRTGDWVDRDVYPVDAADFILASGLQGNMFNFYNWGGYLIWRLAPERKVFVDGRNLNPAMHWQASVIDIGLDKPGPRRWRTLLDRYGVTYVVAPLEYGGVRYPLVERLGRDPDWVAVFKNRNSAVFARRSLFPRGTRP